MTDAQKVEALHSLLDEVLGAYDLTVYDMEDPDARALVNKWGYIFFNRMLAIVNNDEEE